MFISAINRVLLNAQVNISKSTFNNVHKQNKNSYFKLLFVYGISVEPSLENWYYGNISFRDAVRRNYFVTRR